MNNPERNRGVTPVSVDRLVIRLDSSRPATERRTAKILTPSTPSRRREDTRRPDVTEDRATAIARVLAADPTFDYQAWEKWRSLNPDARAAVLQLIDHLSTARHSRATRIRENLRLVVPALLFAASVMT